MSNLNTNPYNYLQAKTKHIHHDVGCNDTPISNAIPNVNPTLTHNASPKANPSYFTAKDLATIYGFPAVNTSISNVVGVLSFGGGLYGTLTPLGDSVNYVLTNGDVQKYWTFVGIPANQMPKVIISLQSGTTNNVSNGATVENTLDVSIIGACCPNPNLTIILYIYPSTYLFTQSLPTALAGITVSNVFYKPSVLSISWGLSEEFIINTTEATNVNTILQTATQNGINICVAAGDNGSTDGSTNGLLYTDFPSSCPYVTSVGGTSLQCPNVIYDSQTVETVWNNGVQGGALSATGGGVSRIYNKPSYQSSISSISTITKRCSPDISLDADPNTGIVIYLNGVLVGKYGGTSISAPIFASYLLLINAKTFINPLLYSISSTNTSCFHDITVGSNYNTSSGSAITSYTATVGYDCCSGLGSIAGVNLTSIINSTPILAISVTVTPTTSTLNINATTQATATVLPSNATNKAVTWSSNHTNIATVNSSGLITAVVSGSVVITVTTADGSALTATVNITVNPSTVLATSLTVSPVTDSLTTGTTLQPSVTVLPPNTNNKTVSWSSNNTNSATVNNITGLITAVAPGSAVITVTTTDGSALSKNINITVTAPIRATRITINKSTNILRLILNQTYEFTATIAPTNTTNKTIAWSSSNTNIININSTSGLATCKLRGIVNITARTTDGSNRNSTIQVQVR